jgi:hypothetical protein
MVTGNYRFRAIYSGDSNYLGSQSGDEEEPLTVEKATTTTTTLLVPIGPITLGQTVYDTVTVTGLEGSYPGPTGTVDFEVSFNGGAWSGFDLVVALSGGTASSITYTPMVTGQEIATT